MTDRFIHIWLSSRSTVAMATSYTLYNDNLAMVDNPRFVPLLWFLKKHSWYCEQNSNKITLQMSWYCNVTDVTVCFKFAHFIGFCGGNRVKMFKLNKIVIASQKTSTNKSECYMPPSWMPFKHPHKTRVWHCCHRDWHFAGMLSNSRAIWAKLCLLWSLLEHAFSSLFYMRCYAGT